MMDLKTSAQEALNRIDTAADDCTLGYFRSDLVKVRAALAANDTAAEPVAIHALRKIAALDYTKAATNFCAHEAVKLATEALAAPSAVAAEDALSDDQIRRAADMSWDGYGDGSEYVTLTPATFARAVRRVIAATQHPAPAVAEPQEVPHLYQHAMTELQHLGYTVENGELMPPADGIPVRQGIARKTTVAAEAGQGLSARRVKNLVRKAIDAHRPVFNSEMRPYGHEEQAAKDAVHAVDAAIDQLAARTTQPAPPSQGQAAWEALNFDLVRECERAIEQRDEFLRTGISTAAHTGASHDTCFGAILNKHGIFAAPTQPPAEGGA